jgi:hypothetical protein
MSRLRNWAPPLLAFALARAVSWVVAARLGVDAFAARTWVQWDAGIYLDIARKGYQLFHCGSSGFGRAEDWCGNTGWMPLYPALIALARTAGIDDQVAGGALSALCHAGALCLIWIAFLESALTTRALLVLAVAAFFPGAIYDQAVFPISLFTLCAAASIDAAARGRETASGLLGAAAAGAYSTGILLAPVLALRRRPLPPLLTAAGFLAVLAAQRIAVGAWDAFFKAQSKYGHHLHDPLGDLSNRVGPLDAPALQTIWVLAFMLAIGFVVWRRRPLAARDRLLAGYALVFWLFPLAVGGKVSLYRAESLLLPAAPLLRHLPVWALALFALAAAAVALPMAELFLRGTLV